MSTATAPPAGGIEVGMGGTPLWPAGKKIQFFGATGPQWSGKSMLGLSIAPGRRNGIARTLAYDMELSLGDYAEGVQCDRIDVPAELIKKYGERETTPLEKFLWFKESVMSVARGKHDVIMVDPVNELESGIRQYVQQNPTKFGYTDKQFERSPPLLETAMQEYWKALLANIASRCQTFYYTVHLRDQFQGATPTGKKEPRGRKVISELSSLFLWLERVAPREGANVGKMPEIPVGKVLKERLGKVEIGADGEVICTPVLPPRLPEASAKAIREYLLNPPNYKRLKADEKYIEPTLSDDERLLLQSQIANTRLQEQEKALEVVREQNKLMGNRRPPPPIEGVKAAETVEAVRATVDATAHQMSSTVAGIASGGSEATPSSTAGTTPEIPASKMALLKELSALKKEVLTDEQYKAILAKRNVASAKDLAEPDLLGIVEKLRNRRTDAAKIAETRKDELSEWANNVATGGGGGGAAPLGN